MPALLLVLLPSVAIPLMAWSKEKKREERQKKKVEKMAVKAAQASKINGSAPQVIQAEGSYSKGEAQLEDRSW